MIIQEFYIGQLFYYYHDKKKVYARLIGIEGSTLYFRNNKGVCFKGSKYLIGRTIFLSIPKPKPISTPSKRESAKQKDYRSSMTTYERYYDRPLQKEDDWSKYDKKVGK